MPPKVARPEGGIRVDRLTCWDTNGIHSYECVWGRLSEIEDILGDNYDLDRLKELVESDRDGRCVALPTKGYTDKDGENALKSAMNTVFYHNNPVTRYIADAVAEKLTRDSAGSTISR